MRLAAFDITGTLLHHATLRPIPLMPHLLKALKGDGWDLAIVTTWPEQQGKSLTERLCEIGNLSSKEIRLCSTTDKGNALRHLRREGYKEIRFIDDKPEHLERVNEVAADGLRVSGFLGSRKYVPLASSCCTRLRIAYTLTAIDLATWLDASLFDTEPLISEMGDDDLIELIAGLRHPMSATAGEDHVFTDRRVALELVRRLATFEAEKKHRTWKRVGWIACEECMWKLVVQMAFAECGMTLEDKLGSVYKAREYTKTLEVLKKDDRDSFEAIITTIWSGFDKMQKGIAEVVAEDDSAVFPKRSPNRMHYIQSIIASLGGRPR